MKKSIGKVVSMVLAAAMITSSFTATLSVSAATRENGTLDLGTDSKDKWKLVSTSDKAYLGNLVTLIGGEGITLDTTDHLTDGGEPVTSDDFVGWSHVSGDKIIQTIATKDTTMSGVVDGSDADYTDLKPGDVVMRANATGEEKISVTFEIETSRDDKDIKVRGSKDITFIADKENSLVVGKSDDGGRPDTIDAASVNDPDYKVALAQVTRETGSFIAKYIAPTTNVEVEMWKGSSNTFKRIEKSDASPYIVEKDTAANTIIVDASKIPSEDKGAPLVLSFKTGLDTTNNKKNVYATVGSETIKVKHSKNMADGEGTKITDSVKLSVGKQWSSLVGTSEINRKSGSTYITTNGAINWDNEDWKTVNKDKDVAKINGYKVLAYGTVKVLGGSVGDIKGKVDSADITVEDGSTGVIETNGAVTVSGGSTGLIKGDTTGVSVSEGTVSSIEAKKAAVVIEGGKVGNVIGKTVEIDCIDEDIPTTVGNVTSKETGNSDDEPTITVDSSSDKAVKVGNLMGSGVELRGEYVTVGDVDNDYRESDVSFIDFKGKVGNLKNVNNALISVEGDSNVSIANKVVADSVQVEEDSVITFTDLNVGSLSGDGVLGIPAGKLFINDGADSITVKLTEGLTVGATAFQAYTGSVRVDDMNLLGFDVDVKSVNSDVEKFVVKGVTFAGVTFDKTDASVAKGSEVKVSLANYPTGTALPKGAQIEWSILADDDYITMTVDATGTFATVKVADYSADRADSNKATITATVLDENGYEYEDANYSAATFTVTGIEKPASTVTIDTKTVNVGTAGVYQFIAKSSTDAVMTAASSNPQVATVALYDSKDARGYKFQVNGVAEGTATITVTDANGATSTMAVTVVKSNGTLKADTTTLKMAPGAIYDVKYTVTGSTAKPVVTCNGNVARISDLGNGKYRITAVNPGNAWVVATVGNARVTVNVNVAAGQALSGVVGNNVSNL